MPMDDKGYTLLELLVALTILSIGVLGLTAMITSGIGTGRFSHAMAVESSIATSVLEEMMARPAADPVFTASSSNVVYDLDPATADTGVFVQGRRYTAVYSVALNNPVTGVARIDIAVTDGSRTAARSSLKSVL